MYFISSAKKHLRPFKKDNAYVEGLIDSEIVTNSALSRIAVRPRCLVVEDRNIGILKRIDDVCGFGLLSRPGDFKRAEGVSKFQTIQQVYLTVQDVVSKKIDLHFLQDSDGLSERYLQYIRRKYQDRSLVAHILERHEIENYMLDAKTVRAALKGKGYDLGLADTRKVIVKATQQIKHDVRGDIRRKAKDVNRFCDKPDRLDDNAVEADVDSWFDNLDLKESTILRIFPGKELKKVLRRVLQEETGVELSDTDLLRAVTKPRVSDDLKDVMKSIVDGWNR